MSAPTATPAPFVVRRAPARPFGLAAVAAAIGLLSLGLAITQTGEAIALVGRTGSMLFGGSAWVLPHIALHGRHPVVVLTSEGLIDNRQRTGPMPWATANHVSEGKMPSARMIMATPASGHAPDLRSKCPDRGPRRTEAAPGIDGVLLDATCTDTRAGRPMAAILAFVAAFAASSVSEPT